MDKQCRNCQASVIADGYPSLLECRRHAPVVTMDTRSEDKFPKVRPDWWCEEFIKKVVPVFNAVPKSEPSQTAVKAESRAVSESMGMPKRVELVVPKLVYAPPIAVKKSVSKKSGKVAAKPAGKR